MLSRISFRPQRCVRKYYKFKVPALPVCHLIVPENGWRIVCSGVKKTAAANAGSSGAENQYPLYHRVTHNIYRRGAWTKRRGSFSLFVHRLCHRRCVYRLHTHACAFTHTPLYHLFRESVIIICYCVKYL